MDIEWVPIVLFTAIAGVLVGYMYFASKSKQAKQTTIQAAIQRGDALTPELIAAIGTEASPPTADFRRGILLLSLSIGLVIFGHFVDPGENEFLGIAAIPGMLGVGYLAMWKFGPKD